MRYFDLHCDTMSKLLENGGNLKENGAHIGLRRAEYIEKYVQCYAAFIPDVLKGVQAFKRFCDIREKFSEELGKNAELKQLKNTGDLSRFEKQGQFAAVFTVENGSAIAGELENIEKLAQTGVKMLTLTWNGENELGEGISEKKGSGISDFGKQAVRKFEKSGIVIDLSHASEKLFWQVVEMAEKPVVASHSNSKKICRNKRNLTDEQFLAIKSARGIVGLNFYKDFLNDSGEAATMNDIVAHAEYFLGLGGENILALGGDMDGSEISGDMSGIESL